MKTILKNNWKSIVLIILILIGLAYVQSKFNTELALRESKIELLEEKVKEQSLIEIFGQKANDLQNEADVNLAEIEHLKLQITSAEEVYEMNILKKRCYQDQIKRMTENMEVDKNFCENIDNLENYKKKH